ncbi:NfeD family protein [Amphibiibacter pelophylacis]|uniref:NfeD family protein n=1 Tax=Amphibiibacter pelophylacis TaxID=1799477 RepID=A0ACC6P5H1_9BURK
MAWSTYTLWAIAAGVAVALELLTGTFYLLMLALGLVAGALVALAGAGMTAQMLVAAAVAILAVGLCHTLRRRSRAGRGATALGLLDVGEVIQVDDWRSGDEALVRYRGATWRAQPHPGHKVRPLQPGAWRVAALQGNTLLLQPATDRSAPLA